MRNGIALPLLSVNLLWLFLLAAGVNARPLGVLNTGVRRPEGVLPAPVGVRRKLLLAAEEGASPRFGVEELLGVRAA